MAGGDYLNQNGAYSNFNRARGTGWLFGPYMSTRLGSDVFLHTSASWGTSSNHIDALGWDHDRFSTKRSVYNAELIGHWLVNHWTASPVLGFTYYHEEQNQFINTINVFIPSQQINLGQINVGPDLSYNYLTDELKEITWHLSLQALYNFNGKNGIDNLVSSAVNGFSNRIKLGTDIRWPSGLRLSPMLQYDGLGFRQFSGIQGILQVSLPLDKKQRAVKVSKIANHESNYL